MHTPSLRALLADLFEAHGYRTTRDTELEGRSGHVFKCPLLAEDDGFAVLVDPRAATEPLTSDQVARMADVVEDVGAERGLIVHLGMAQTGAQGAGAGRIALWDRDTTSAVLGNLALHHAEGVPLDPLPLEADVPMLESEPQELSGLPDLLPAAFFDEPVFEDPAPAPFDAFDAFPTPSFLDPVAPEAPAPSAVASPFAFPSIDFDALESLDAPTPSSPSFARAPAPAPTAFPVLAPRLSAEGAAAHVRDKMYATDARHLVLQPVHLIDYECDLFADGSLRYDTVRGRLQVHGTRKTVEEVPREVDPSATGPLPADAGRYEERTLRVTEERAMQLAHEAVITGHSRTVDVETSGSDGDFCMTERKKVAPRPDQIRLRHVGTVHRPAWHLQSPNGHLLVDALSGTIVDQGLRSPSSDIIMLD